MVFPSDGLFGKEVRKKELAPKCPKPHPKGQASTILDLTVILQPLGTFTVSCKQVELGKLRYGHHPASHSELELASVWVVEVGEEHGVTDLCLRVCPTMLQYWSMKNNNWLQEGGTIRDEKRNITEK